MLMIWLWVWVPSTIRDLNLISNQSPLGDWYQGKRLHNQQRSHATGMACHGCEVLYKHIYDYERNWCLAMRTPDCDSRLTPVSSITDPTVTLMPMVYHWCEKELIEGFNGRNLVSVTKVTQHDSHPFFSESLKTECSELFRLSKKCFRLNDCIKFPSN